jgi:hypothetical protein
MVGSLFSFAPFVLPVVLYYVVVANFKFRPSAAAMTLAAPHCNNNDRARNISEKYVGDEINKKKKSYIVFAQ